MSGVSPPKPWERAGGASGPVGSALAAPAAAPRPSTTSPATASTTSTAPSVTSTTSAASPAVPQRPSSLSTVANRNASTYSGNTMNRPYGSSPYGMSSPYSSYGGYSSPYSRFGGGGFGSGMYGGGSMYGGGMYGGGMYGGGGGGMYGAGGMYGQPGDPNDPNNPNNSLTNNFAQSTQATFQLIESIVGAFGGFAQMLESTYMATHSSFFAMVSVAEQFGNLRQTLGSILGIYTVLRWLRTLIAKVTGRPPPADAMELTPSAFHAFATGGKPPGPMGPDGRPVPKPSKKPFVIFILAVFGLPYLMGKLIRALAKNQEETMNNQQGAVGPDGQPQQRPFDPSQLDFCRVLYDFPPQEAVAAGNFDNNMDLSVKQGDLVAVLEKTDPSGQQGSQEGQWWRCRARDGRIGYLPAVYLEKIVRKPAPAAIENSVASRSNTMPAAVTQPTKGEATSRAATMSSSATAIGTEDEKNKKIEQFQKAWVSDR